MSNIEVSVRAAARSVGAESEAVVAGISAAIVGGVLGGVVFAGAHPAIWGEGFSVGVLAAITVLALTVVASYVGYWRSRHVESQSWRLELKPWKFIIDSTAVAGVHAVTAGILTVVVFIVVQLSFRGLHVDGWTSAFGVATAAGLTCYYVYLSVSQMSTSKMATLLVLFMAVAVLASMVTAQDPQWWEYHFSYLGTFGDRSSALFNFALIFGGALVTTFALYLGRDIQALVERGVLTGPRPVRIVTVVFIIMGVLLACVGAFPFNRNPLIHNLSAIGMSLVFITFLIVSPRVLRGMPRTFFGVTGGLLAALIVSAILYGVTHYLNLAAFELVAFVIIFGWISTFIRFISATVEPTAVASSTSTSTSTVPSSELA